MYNENFLLTASPFLNTPDPAFLFDSRSHKETLASMAYGVLEGKGFILVTGDVGSGKTLLAQALKREIAGHVLIEIANPWVTPEEILEAVQIGVGLPALTGVALWEPLREKLVALADAGRRVALLIDEAQQLPERSLEGLCLLSNLETATQKLIQIVLLGQTELATKLNSHTLRHLYQRVTLRACLQHLTRNETVLYIRHRLRIAGGSPQLFPPECIDLIYQESKGIPRIINTLCDKCLLFAYGRQSPHVTLEITQDAIRSQWPEKEVNGAVPMAEALVPATAPVAVAQPRPEPVAVPTAAREKEAPQPKKPPAGRPDAKEEPQAPDLPFNRRVDDASPKGGEVRPAPVTRKGFGVGHLFLMLLFGIAVGALILWIDPQKLTALGLHAPSAGANSAGKTTPEPAGIAPVYRDAAAEIRAAPTAPAERPLPISAPPLSPVASPATVAAPLASRESEPSEASVATAASVLPLPGAVPGSLKLREEKTSAKSTVRTLANNHYGAWNETIRDLLAAANPEVSSFEALPVGTKLQFPMYSREGLVVKDGQGRFFVYYGSFDKAEYARANLEAIKRSFSAAELFPAQSQGIQTQRLMVGPLISKSEAQAVANSLWFKYIPILN